MSAAAAQKGLALLLDFDPACPPIVTIDVNRLRQILENLLGNAIKFTESGYVILAFKAREKPGHDVNWSLDIMVRDSGIGIPRTEQATLFDAFTQVTNVDHKTQPGTGLGLAISKQLVELMGGEIAVSSQVKVGSEFTLHFQVHGPELALRAQMPRQHVLLIDPLTEEAEIIVRRLRALGLFCTIVDDDQSASQYLTHGGQVDSLIRSDLADQAEPRHYEMLLSLIGKYPSIQVFHLTSRARCSRRMDDHQAISSEVMLRPLIDR